MRLENRNGFNGSTATRSAAAHVAALLLALLPGLRESQAADLESLQQAALAGDAGALLQLGERHERGEGLEQDFAAAAYYLRLAAERGNAPAQYRLGQYHWAGLGVAEDLQESYTWLATAATSGGDAAILAESLMPSVAREMTPAQLERVEGRVEAFRAASAPAQLHLATLRAQPPSVERIERFLPAGNCGRLRIHELDGGGYRVAGYVREGGATQRLDPSAQSYFSAHAIALELEELIERHCKVLASLSRRTAELGESTRIAIHDGAGKARERFHNGDYFVVELSGFDEDRHVAVDFFLQDGSVVHMLPNSQSRGTLLRARQSLSLGKPGTGGKSWQIGPPFGKELLVIYASSTPLYPGQRPEVEATEEYLAYLRRRLNDSSEGTGADVRAHFRIVKTAP